MSLFVSFIYGIKHNYFKSKKGLMLLKTSVLIYSRESKKKI